MANGKKTDRHRPSTSAWAGPGFLAREDLWNQNKDSSLGSVRADYTPLQNAQAFSFLDPIVQSGVASYESAGILGKGEFVWIMLRFHNDLEIGPHDLMAKFLLFGNAPTTGYHRMVYLPVRLISNNTLSCGTLHNPEPLVTTPKIRPRQFQDSIDSAVEKIQYRFREMASEFRAMAHRGLTQEGLGHYLKMVFSDYNRKIEYLRQEERLSWMSADREQHFKECARLFVEGQGNDLPGAKGTLWAALNAVAEYADFDLHKPSDSGSLEEVWFSELKGSALKVARSSLKS